MRPYMNDGRFGEWVTNFITAENKRRKEEAEKENDRKLWELYIHSYSEKSFIDWKASVVKSSPANGAGKDDYMTKEQVNDLFNRLIHRR